MLYEGVTVINGLFSTTGEGVDPPKCEDGACKRW